MRKVFLCLLGLAGFLGAFDFVAVGNSTSLVAAVQSPKGDLQIDRTLKGDRQVAVRAKAETTAPAAPTAAAKDATRPATTPAPVNARLPDGCEPSFSPLAGKTVSATTRARCIS